MGGLHSMFLCFFTYSTFWNYLVLIQVYPFQKLIHAFLRLLDIDVIDLIMFFRLPQIHFFHILIFIPSVSIAVVRQPVQIIILWMDEGLLQFFLLSSG